MAHGGDMKSQRPISRKVYRVGASHETIMSGGMLLQAKWESAWKAEDDTFSECQINGRSVTPAVYKQHRDRVNGRS